MSIRKTLGGDRLGSGKKMKVDLHGFDRSTFDLSYIWRSTMSPGTLVPFLVEQAQVGDTFDIHLNMHANTHPTVGPLFGSFKAQLDVFVAPLRLYHSAMHNNRLGIGLKMSDIKLPKLELLATPIDETHKDIDNSQINPSCIMSYLGVRGVASHGDEDKAKRKFNAIPLLAYWEIYKNYYSNKQEEIGAVISNGPSNFPRTVLQVRLDSVALPEAPGQITNGSLINGTLINVDFTGAVPDVKSIWINFWGYDEPVTLAELSDDWTTGPSSPLQGHYNWAKWGNRLAKNWAYLDISTYNQVEPEILTFPLSNIDDMREKILQSPYNAEFNINAQNISPYKELLTIYQVDTPTNEWAPVTQNNQEGLALKTYQSDLFNNWLSTEWIDGAGGINEITAIDTSSGSFNIDTLILAKKVYMMLNRIAVSGGTYNDWIEANWGQEVWNRAESPVYMGGLIKEVVFQEVVSNSQAVNTDNNTTQPLGTLAGKGVMGNKHKGGTVVIRVDEPSIILGICSLTPRVDYSQGNRWFNHLKTMDDLHKPGLDGIGFQELITEEMAWWSTTLMGFTPSETPVYLQKSAGKQPAWINYMTNVNRTYGNFAIKDNQMFMTLNRRYEPAADLDGSVKIKDLTTYIDPAKYNYIFAQTSRDAQNFWVQISVDMIARRKMSSKVMPNL